MKYGAQDLSPFDSGAYTGDISGVMLAKLGCTYVTIGHSERREYPQRHRRGRQSKVLAAVKHGIAPILCVGEGLDGPRGGPARRAHDPQLLAGLKKVTPEQARRWSSRTSRSGRSAPAGWRVPPTPRRCARRCGRQWPGRTARRRRRGPDALRGLGEGRATSARSWPSPTWTVRWSAGPAWTPTSSRSCAPSPPADRCRTGAYRRVASSDYRITDVPDPGGDRAAGSPVPCAAGRRMRMGCNSPCRSC